MIRITAAVCLSLALAVSVVRHSAAATPPSSAVADTAFAHHDWAAAEDGYAAFVKLAPASARAWYRLGFARQSLGRFAPAIEAYRQADALGAAPAFARYNLACSFARAGQPDSALAALHRLLDTGWGGTGQLEGDADFASLRNDPRFPVVLQRSRHNEQPCADRAESRQFDFWIGDWAVTQNTPGGGPAGDSHIELILQQCVIFEHWTGRSGGSGKSLNAWNADKSCWQQTWMDDRGDVTNYTEGRFADGRLSFNAYKKNAAGTWQKHRLSFYPLDTDHVRQLGEHSEDNGATWVTDYDLLYTRKR